MVMGVSIQSGSQSTRKQLHFHTPIAAASRQRQIEGQFCNAMHIFCPRGFIQINPHKKKSRYKLYEHNEYICVEIGWMDMPIVVKLSTIIKTYILMHAIIIIIKMHHRHQIASVSQTNHICTRAHNGTDVFNRWSSFITYRYSSEKKKGIKFEMEKNCIFDDHFGQWASSDGRCTVFKVLKNWSGYRVTSSVQLR